VYVKYTVEKGNGNEDSETQECKGGKKENNVNMILKSRSDFSRAYTLLYWSLCLIKYHDLKTCEGIETCHALFVYFYTFDCLIHRPFILLCFLCMKNI
jgi:hypothetical protein